MILAEKHREQPALLAGDLNATPDSKTLEQFGSIWTRANDSPLATIPVDQPNKQTVSNPGA
jgi:endonuclease/exonuclease/phosphatase (EEP) superfamily protein YafD